MGDTFKHIKVTAPGQDDEVVYAGTAREHAEPIEPAIAPSADPGPASATDPSTAPDPAPMPQPASAPKRPHHPDQYHETTLEDLRGEGMPLAQKIVIIAAIVCIIGALVYYFVAMR